jgi:hypothetical protein
MTNTIDLRSHTPRSNGTRSEDSIEHIARHHSATSDGDFKTFWKYWNGVKGWGTGGYAEIILRDGTVQICYDPNEITNGIANHNSTTYHICVVGNGSFTDAQEKAWEERCLYNLKRFGLTPDKVKGHREFSGASTACPGIDMGMVRNRLIYLRSKPTTPVKQPVKQSEVKGLSIVEEYKKDAQPSKSLAVKFKKAVALGITDGTYPQRPGTREEMAVMIVKAIEHLQK